MRFILFVLALLVASPAFAADPVYSTVGLAGSSSGTITLKPQAAAGTYNWNFPTSAGTSGQVLLSAGGGTSPMTWGSLGVAGGGTGRSSLTSHGILLGEGTSAINQTSAMTNGQLLIGSTGADPAPQTMSGDCTITSAGVLTCTKLNSVAYGSSPSTNTVPVVTSSNTITYEAVPNSALANSSITVSGSTCTLGSSCSPSASFGSITDGDILANISGSSAAPTEHTVSDVFDYVFGSTSAHVLIRGASGWDDFAIGGDCTISNSGSLTCTKTNGSNFVASATTDTTSASNISSGTLAAARGGAGTISGALKGNGSGVVSQAACADLSNGATGCSTATGTSGATIPLLNGTNTWSGQQSGSVTTLSISTATFTPDGTNNHYKLTLSHAACPCTLANPSATPVAGTSGTIEVIQSSSGSDTIGTWGSSYMAPSGTSSLTLSTGANAIDVLSYFVIDATHILLIPSLNFSH